MNSLYLSLPSLALSASPAQSGSGSAMGLWESVRYGLGSVSYTHLTLPTKRIV